MLISYQALGNVIHGESGEAAEVSMRHILPVADFNYDRFDTPLNKDDQIEFIRRNVFNKLSKRRAQAKANLAGLWGVPTRYA